jgi:uridine phosphorylase
LHAAFASKTGSGITITCPGFYGPQGRMLRAPIAFPGLIDSLASFSSGGQRVSNFEMETSAIYGLGKLLGHQCLSVSTIIANRATQRFSSAADAAIDRMIVLALDVISRS